MIQIFGTNKSFDTKSALRFFKERRIPFQFVDLKEKEMSKGEFDSVFSAISKESGGAENALKMMCDEKSKDFAVFSYLDESEKKEKLFENQMSLLRLPVCRNGKTAATVGIKKEIWETWK